MGSKREKKEKQDAETFRLLAARSQFLEDDADVEEDELKYAGIVEYCRQNDTLFHDGEFPHIRKSFMSLKKAEKGKLSFKNWAGLIEKAIAKYRGGSYDNLQCYNSEDALGIMTGSPILAVSPSRNDCWDLLKIGSANSFPMTCGTYIKDMDNQGIVPKHAYTIIGYKEMEGHQLVRIRNPTGFKKWKGKWSTSWCMEQSSKSATTDFILSISKMGDRTEFLEWEDFSRIFETVWICRYRPSWHVIRAKLMTDGKMDGTQKMVRISVPANCDVCVSAQKKDCNRRYVYTWLMIYQVNEEDPHWIGETVACELIYDYSKDIRLVAGDYVIDFADFFLPNKIKLNVAIHSSKPISVRFIDSNPFTVTQMVQRIVEEKGKEVSGNKSGDMSIKKYKAIDNNATIMIMATNYSSHRNLHVNLFSDPKMLSKWHISRTDKECYADVIPPRSRQILLVVKRCGIRSEPEFASRIDYWLSDEKLAEIRGSDRDAHIPSIGLWDYLHFTTAID